MGFPRQEYRSGFPFPFLGDLPNIGIEPASPPLVGIVFTAEPPGESLLLVTIALNLGFFHYYSDMMGYKFHQSVLARNYITSEFMFWLDRVSNKDSPQLQQINNNSINE